MKFLKFFIILTVLMLSASVAAATQTPWNVTINATNQLEPVTFGYHPNATDGYDPEFDEFTQHPVQGKVIMSLDEIYAVNIKKDNLMWNLSVGVPTVTTLTWDTSEIPADINLSLINETSSINMKLQNSLNLSGGAYYFLIKVSGLPSTALKGDLDRDGKVTIADLTKLAWMVLDKIPDDLSADFNGNGRVDIGDLAKLAYYILGEISEL